MIWDAVNDRFQDHGRADVVIADLPCSGLGVLGKKPDIKYNMTQNQQKELVSLQRRILSTACQYVKPGGVLIYSTCTVNKEENIENMEWFLENHDFHADSLLPYISGRLSGKEAESGYLQLIQGIHDCDGFFISRMRRNMRD
jgi:16S rRNA (cytosine967-C5)-methyltransferase